MIRNPLIWSLIQRFGSEGLRFGVFFVLALLLDPREFGILGIATLWIGFISVFSDLGLSSALIQRASIEPGHLSTAFYLNVGLGSTLAVTGALLSPLIARLFQVPGAQPIIAILSLGFVLTSVSLTQQALAYRELRLRDIATRDISASLFGGVCAIVLAFRGLGVWSLVVQSLASSAASSLLLWRMSPWRPYRREVSAAHFRDLWGYGSTILLFSGFKYVSQNVDKFIIGLLLGTPSLGLYSFAYRLVVYPVSLLAGALGGYQFPRYSRMQDDLQRVRTSYLSFSRATATLVLPALLLIGAFSPAVIPAVFGWKWAPAVPIAQVFTFAALSVMIISPAGNLMKALGRPAWLLWWSIGFTLATASFLWMGSSWGIVGAAAGLAAAYLVGLPINGMVTCKLLHMRVRDLLHPFVPSVVGTLAAGLVLWAASGMSELWGNIGLAVAGVLGLAAYLLVVYWLDRTFLSVMLAKVMANEAG